MHPKYGTIGLGVKLVREPLGLVETEFIEMPAVMAKYNPFAEKAGMTKVCEQRPSKEAMNIAEILSSLGSNLRFLSARSKVKTTILSSKQRTITKKSLACSKKALSTYARRTTSFTSASESKCKLENSYENAN